ncbi:glycosyltransferase family 25 protein [Epibacterium ulvae]|uniref:glycosyltransferase family 25 protein n=1 Tax=Epibacterium ulvae TaxID=1156985 RepID=UPI001BFC5721|nr:glycosyltransferase family 25 protein [Epibacterium ulvae]MBT8154859.1 glycosyltransferase family 25 protein [Epibacterium ulvae]
MKLATYLISLTRATGRHAQMGVTLAAAQVEAKYVEAVDLQDTPHEELLRKCNSFGPWGVFAPGNMACTLSHAKVWETFLASDADVALVLEDDVFLSPELQHWLEDLSWWPQGCQMVSLEFWRSKSMRVLLGASARSHLGRNVAPMLSRYPGAAGYMLTRKGAEVLLAQAPFDMTVDALLFNPMVSAPARDLKPVQIDPALIKQGNTPIDEDSFLGHAARKPSGELLKRQKRLRGIAELKAVPLQLLRLVTGAARLTRVTYADRTFTDDSAAAAAQANTA